MGFRRIESIIGYFVLASFLAFSPLKTISAQEQVVNQTIFNKVPSYNYQNISFQYQDWKEIAKGLQFTKIEVYQEDKKVDTVAVVKAEPKYNLFRVFNGFNQKTKTLEETLTIEEWQAKTNATVIFNSAQYADKPWGMPLALIKCNGVVKGLINKHVRGIFVADSLKQGLPSADLLDLRYDQNKMDAYKEAVQHWPILLDRNGEIRVNPTAWQASRTVIAKDFDRNILVFTTEGGFFTLYNFGRFLKDNKEKLHVHTAMNLDGGYEADMMIKSLKYSYLTYGWAETKGANQDDSKFGKINLPRVIGIFPRY
ncbi:phosphodiester glycosidase family protein [archaeon]|nr:phosphodiester glycosidase family protein [archaeon]